ncbi:hypothetical protein Alches_25840 [Alicyclobacillus hesperidum subsp. aegles]|uniref:hypothetical protein n=1 Tax=Alicyclobacillus TaxID=29330 RepID=UPI001192F5C4|nr:MULTISPECIES: hypothetical protein [Alicyclobacillus]GEO27482.1 hypothetical protein AAC03nite_32670 [Alicyclobacillus acidoterrestris]GLG02543.1 hypothetical protein Alches_25840 [Alicyclobacillus hesperidum subsp. aegles]
MVKQLSETLYFIYKPKSYNEKPVIYEVTTDEGLQEVARLALRQIGYIHFASAEEFRAAIEMERLTDDCVSGSPIGAAWDTESDSVFYVAL